jgi:mono/diheme cytochrome c family protein
VFHWWIRIEAMMIWTRHHRWAVALFVFFFGASGLVLVSCGRPPGEMAPSTMPPTLNAAVGPIPGSGSGPNPANPYASDRGAMAQGRQLFTRFNCAGCHGDHGGGGMGPSLRARHADVGREIERRRNLEARRLYQDTAHA